MGHLMWASRIFAADVLQLSNRVLLNITSCLHKDSDISSQHNESKKSTLSDGSNIRLKCQTYAADVLQVSSKALLQVPKFLHKHPQFQNRHGSTDPSVSREIQQCTASSGDLHSETAALTDMSTLPVPTRAARPTTLQETKDTLGHRPNPNSEESMRRLDVEGKIISSRTFFYVHKLAKTTSSTQSTEIVRSIPSCFSTPQHAFHWFSGTSFPTCSRFGLQGAPKLSHGFYAMQEDQGKYPPELKKFYREAKMVIVGNSSGILPIHPAESPSGCSTDNMVL